MTTYICKCGRLVAKSTTADNTGNRDTAGCEGCPYLLPWGPYQYVEGQGVSKDVQGYECRMSKDLDYATRFGGSITDKCTCYIASLDFDFLTRVSDWIKETYPGKELVGSFSVSSIRAVEYSSNGRYRMGISCVQNKKGIAAKAALLHRFFDDSGARLDMTPEEEKAHILAAIEAGKARAKKKEGRAVIYKDPATGWLYRVSPKPVNGEDMYGMEYLDPKSGHVWKPNVKWNTGATYRDRDHLQAALEARARRDSWEPVEDVPGENPTCSAAATAADEETVAAPETPDSASMMAAPVAKASELQDVAAENALAGASGSTSFDYSGLDAGTAERLQNLARRAMEAKQRYVLDLMEIVVEAHRELCDTVVARCDNGVVQRLDNSKHGNRGEESFRRWCECIGVGRSTAYNLLQVQALMDGSTPEEQEVLAEAPAKLLYAAAKPSAPAELVQAVKDGDITTHKQYQELLAEVRERDAKIQELLEMSEAADRRADEAQAWAKKTEQEAALDRKEREDANAAAMRYKAECDRRAAEQQRVEGLLTTREDQLRASQAEVARQKRIGMEMQEEVKSRDERIRELEQSQTVVASTADPEEIERRAHEIAQSQIAENDAKWTEITENQGRQLRELRAAAGAAQAVRIAIRSVQSILESLFQTMLPEKDDIAGQAALEELDDLLSEYSNYIHDMFRTEENREEAEV